MPEPRNLPLSRLAEKLVKTLIKNKLTLAAAESCTGGLASEYLTRIPGASAVFWGSFITYTPDAKTKMLGIPGRKIEKYGAVSEPVALAMALGALKRSGASIAFSVTGLAGPGNDGSGTPVGTVWIGVADYVSQSCEAKSFLFHGSRGGIREAAAAAAFREILKMIKTLKINGA